MNANNLFSISIIPACDTRVDSAVGEKNEGSISLTLIPTEITWSVNEVYHELSMECNDLSAYHNCTQ